jgi:DNA-binding NarL/FixJ family response regulator
MASNSTRVASVLVVDDHPLTRQGITALLASEPDLNVVGQAGTLEEARRMAAELRPDLVLLDLYLPDGDSLGLLEDLRSQPDPPRVVVLTAHNDQDHIAAKAMRLGASGFVGKQVFGEEMLRILRDAVAGKHYLSAETIEKLIHRRRK